MVKKRKLSCRPREAPGMSLSTMPSSADITAACWMQCLQKGFDAYGETMVLRVPCFRGRSRPGS